MSSYQVLMQKTHSAHQNFKDQWKKWELGKLKGPKPNIEPQSVTIARNVFLAQLDILFDSKINPLEGKFRESPNLAVEELVEFLLTDITAFRCGYAKEVFLQWLKKTEFLPAEAQMFRQVAITICELNSFRREFRRWCRLMTKLADEKFVLELQKLRLSESHYARIKSGWMIEMIWQHRKDLRHLRKNQ
jgi:hypothetical protein